MLSEVELIIDNAPLTYVYPNTIEICLTPNYLLFGRQLLYSGNTTSIVVRNLIVLWSTTDKINRISNQFLHRWGHEYVVHLRETQRTWKWNINSLKKCGWLGLVLYKKVLRHFWRIAIVTWVLPSRVSEIRGAIVRTIKTNIIHKRPVNKQTLRSWKYISWH